MPLGFDGLRSILKRRYPRTLSCVGNLRTSLRSESIGLIYWFHSLANHVVLRFMSSEADLDTEIKNLSILSEHPELYGEFAKMGCVGSLISLLSHENADIAIDAIQIISELTDEDVEAEQEQWDTLVNAMVCSPICLQLHRS